MDADRSLVVQKYPAPSDSAGRGQGSLEDQATCLEVTNDGRVATIRYPSGVIAVRYEFVNLPYQGNCSRLYAAYEDGSLAADWYDKGFCIAKHAGGKGDTLLSHQPSAMGNPAMGTGALFDGEGREVDRWDCPAEKANAAFRVLTKMQQQQQQQQQNGGGGEGDPPNRNPPSSSSSSSTSLLLSEEDEKAVTGWHPRTVQLSSFLAFRLEPLRGLFFCFHHGDLRYMINFGAPALFSVIGRIYCSLWPFQDDVAALQHAQDQQKRALMSAERGDTGEPQEDPIAVVHEGLTSGSRVFEEATRKQCLVQQQQGAEAALGAYSDALSLLSASRGGGGVGGASDPLHGVCGGASTKLEALPEGSDEDGCRSSRMERNSAGGEAERSPGLISNSVNSICLSNSRRQQHGSFPSISHPGDGDGDVEEESCYKPPPDGAASSSSCRIKGAWEEDGKIGKCAAEGGGQRGEDKMDTLVESGTDDGGALLSHPVSAKGERDKDKERTPSVHGMWLQRETRKAAERLNGLTDVSKKSLRERERERERERNSRGGGGTAGGTGAAVTQEGGGGGGSSTGMRSKTAGGVGKRASASQDKETTPGVSRKSSGAIVHRRTSRPAPPPLKDPKERGSSEPSQAPEETNEASQTAHRVQGDDERRQLRSSSHGGEGGEAESPEPSPPGRRSRDAAVTLHRSTARSQNGSANENDRRTRSRSRSCSRGCGGDKTTPERENQNRNVRTGAAARGGSFAPKVKPKLKPQVSAPTPSPSQYLRKKKSASASIGGPSDESAGTGTGPQPVSPPRLSASRGQSGPSTKASRGHAGVHVDSEEKSEPTQTPSRSPHPFLRRKSPPPFLANAPGCRKRPNSSSPPPFRDASRNLKDEEENRKAGEDVVEPSGEKEMERKAENVPAPSQKRETDPTPRPTASFEPPLTDLQHSQTTTHMMHKVTRTRAGAPVSGGTHSLSRCLSREKKAARSAELPDSSLPPDAPVAPLSGGDRVQSHREKEKKKEKDGGAVKPRSLMSLHEKKRSPRKSVPPVGSWTNNSGLSQSQKAQQQQQQSHLLSSTCAPSSVAHSQLHQQKNLTASTNEVIRESNPEGAGQTTAPEHPLAPSPEWEDGTPGGGDLHHHVEEGREDVPDGAVEQKPTAEAAGVREELCVHILTDSGNGGKSMSPLLSHSALKSFQEKAAVALDASGAAAFTLGLPGPPSADELKEGAKARKEKQQEAPVRVKASRGRSTTSSGLSTKPVGKGSSKGTSTAAAAAFVGPPRVAGLSIAALSNSREEALTGPPSIAKSATRVTRTHHAGGPSRVTRTLTGPPRTHLKSAERERSRVKNTTGGEKEEGKEGEEKNVKQDVTAPIRQVKTLVAPSSAHAEEHPPPPATQGDGSKQSGKGTMGGRGLSSALRRSRDDYSRPWRAANGTSRSAGGTSVGGAGGASGPGNRNSARPKSVDRLPSVAARRRLSRARRMAETLAPVGLGRGDSDADPNEVPSPPSMQSPKYSQEQGAKSKAPAASDQKSPAVMIAAGQGPMQAPANAHPSFGVTFPFVPPPPHTQASPPSQAFVPHLHAVTSPVGPMGGLHGGMQQQQAYTDPTGGAAHAFSAYRAPPSHERVQSNAPSAYRHVDAPTATAPPPPPSAGVNPLLPNVLPYIHASGLHPHTVSTAGAPGPLRTNFSPPPKGLSSASPSGVIPSMSSPLKPTPAAAQSAVLVRPPFAVVRPSGQAAAAIPLVPAPVHGDTLPSSSHSHTAHSHSHPNASVAVPLLRPSRPPSASAAQACDEAAKAPPQAEVSNVDSISAKKMGVEVKEEASQEKEKGPHRGASQVSPSAHLPPDSSLGRGGEGSKQNPTNKTETASVQRAALQGQREVAVEGMQPKSGTILRQVPMHAQTQHQAVRHVITTGAISQGATVQQGSGGHWGKEGIQNRPKSGTRLGPALQSHHQTGAFTHYPVPYSVYPQAATYTHAQQPSGSNLQSPHANAHRLASVPSRLSMPARFASTRYYNANAVAVQQQQRSQHRHAAMPFAPAVRQGAAGPGAVGEYAAQQLPTAPEEKEDLSLEAPKRNRSAPAAAALMMPPHRAAPAAAAPLTHPQHHAGLVHLWGGVSGGTSTSPYAFGMGGVRVPGGDGGAFPSPNRHAGGFVTTYGNPVSPASSASHSYSHSHSPVYLLRAAAAAAHPHPQSAMGATAHMPMKRVAGSLFFGSRQRPAPTGAAASMAEGVHPYSGGQVEGARVMASSSSGGRLGARLVEAEGEGRKFGALVQWAAGRESRTG
uniref:Uncharacterized protein n=1 Tax=Chromera velia CCMP2878 TaxID=1169474 RepID=A0A0G4F875_9ALVE|eukprot:Cvel_15743.t1-p1 / transcript=Cvel_15743.t1 / gene=Cvel_15743 / organism=Chromera_velia_CCMP2878 / gene_product=hypothetical protein / transcript_product=hypothetical protein / location=Cvel_scaffold1178:18782-29327(+) / protein_length=2260 / sequence_SO=supercontig / SO=protein_coding / is_pseudo=false